MHVHLFVLGVFSEKDPEDIKTTNKNQTLYEEWD
jgi:hypothetical protein